MGASEKPMIRGSPSDMAQLPGDDGLGVGDREPEEVELTPAHATPESRTSDRDRIGALWSEIEAARSDARFTKLVDELLERDRDILDRLAE
jgi:hypothetical protein